MGDLLKLSSDFTDYYDGYFNEYGMEYRRVKSDAMPRGRALKYLESLGYNVISLSQISIIQGNPSKVVVYTDLYGHYGKGKIVCSYGEALDSYSNYLGAPYIEGTNGVSIKVIQVGSRRFRLLMRNTNYKSELCHGAVLSIEEMSQEFNDLIRLPVFSVDYIPYNDAMLVIDFNETQELKSLGFESIMSPSEVVSEIKKSIYHYTKRVPFSFSVYNE